MTLLTLVLIAVIVLAVIGIGWQTFAVAVLDGFDRTLDVAIPVIKNLTRQAQAQQQQQEVYGTTDISQTLADLLGSSSSGNSGISDNIFSGGLFGGDSSANSAEFDPNGTLTEVNATMSNYTNANADYGFTLLLPSTNWSQQEPGITVEGLHTVILEDGSNPGTTLDITVFTTQPYLDPETTTVKNYTIQEYANNDVLVLQSLQYSGSSSVNIAADVTKNQPQGDAWRLEYITSVGGMQTTFNIRILVLNPETGYLYKLDFSSPALEAPQLIPVANKIIESFRFL
jgi:hypothetical protein